MYKSLTDTFTLSNGIEIPCVGYGTYKTPDGEVCSNGVRCALENGYRHIDTAELYANETGVGIGIKQSGVDRKDIFVSTKVWNTNQGYDTTIEAFYRSLEKLQFDYLDLYLIHWPIAFDFKAEYPKQFLETWRAMEDLYKKGVVRAIGVCNCLKSHLNTLLCNCEIKPMVNQIEYHMGYMQEEAVEFSKENGLLVEAWAPLCKAKVLGQEPLKSIAGKYGKTEAQVMVRWCLQHGTLPLPKSVHDDRIIENAQVFDFNISDEDMAI
ncbi:MAG: aldo/keto reductase, partial [Clostridia bacterium]|nr:aldo/keto reductase [Clostridia bacterium]